MLDNLTEVRSVLDMTTAEKMQCEDCGRLGTDGFEIHDYIGARKKRFPLPRCTDRKACERRVSQEATDAHTEMLIAAASNLSGLRQWVKTAEKELAHLVQDALRENVSATAIARAAGISRERVYQIRDGRR